MTASANRSRCARSFATVDRALVARELVCGGQTDRPGDVLGAGAAVALLGATLLLRQDVRAVPDIERSDALRPLELVRPERDEVCPERLDIDVDVRCRLDRVDVEDEALARSHPGGDLGDRLDRAHLVVGEHDRDEDRLVVERRLELVGVHPAVAVDRQLDDLEAELLEVAQRVPDRVVLDRRGHDAMAARLAGPRRALEREVVRLGAAGREDDLAALRVELRQRPCRVRRRARPGRCARSCATSSGCRTTRSGTATSRRGPRAGVGSSRRGPGRSASARSYTRPLVASPAACRGATSRM